MFSFNWVRPLFHSQSGHLRIAKERLSRRGRCDHPESFLIDHPDALKKTIEKDGVQMVVRASVSGVINNGKHGVQGSSARRGAAGEATLGTYLRYIEGRGVEPIPMLTRNRYRSGCCSVAWFKGRGQSESGRSSSGSGQYAGFRGGGGCFQSF